MRVVRGLAHVNPIVQRSSANVFQRVKTAFANAFATPSFAPVVA